MIDIFSLKQPSSPLKIGQGAMLNSAGVVVRIFCFLKTRAGKGLESHVDAAVREIKQCVIHLQKNVDEAKCIAPENGWLED